MKRILIFFRAWRGSRILRRLSEVDLELELAEYGYADCLWSEGDPEIARLHQKKHRLEEKLSRLV